jgi:hypothetical protein
VCDLAAQVNLRTSYLDAKGRYVSAGFVLSATQQTLQWTWLLCVATENVALLNMTQASIWNSWDCQTYLMHCRFVRDRWRIARGYFRYWFWIDALSSVSAPQQGCHVMPMQSG